MLSVATAVPLTEYLNTSYRPDCDYLEGELLERNVGEWDHARLQVRVGNCLSRQEKQSGILVVLAQRIQVKARRFRIPDIAVVAGKRPDTGIITQPPFLCVEILSPRDRVVEMQDRIHDYLDFGVRYVWLIDPRSGLTLAYTDHGVQEIKNDILNTKDPDIQVNLNELELRA